MTVNIILYIDQPKFGGVGQDQQDENGQTKNYVQEFEKLKAKKNSSIKKPFKQS